MRNEGQAGYVELQGGSSKRYKFFERYEVDVTDHHHHHHLALPYRLDWGCCLA